MNPYISTDAEKRQDLYWSTLLEQVLINELYISLFLGFVAVEVSYTLAIN